MSETGTLQAEERLFLAEDTLIDIYPSFRSDVIHLIAADYGPFRPQIPVSVPLWLAIMLRQGQHCTLRPPTWLNVDTLEALMREEAAVEDAFSALPYHWQEIATLILDVAAEDVDKSEKVRLLIQRLKERRSVKIQAGMSQIDDRPIQLNHIGCGELAGLKPFFTATAGLVHRYTKALTQARIRAARGA